MRAGGASALLSDSRMAPHEQSPPGISSSARIRRHRPWPNEMTFVLHVERQTDGNTKVPAQVSPLSVFFLLFFFFWSDFDLLVTGHQITIDNSTRSNCGCFCYNWADKQPYFIGSEIHIVLHWSSLPYFSCAVWDTPVRLTCPACLHACRENGPFTVHCLMTSVSQWHRRVCQPACRATAVAGCRSPLVWELSLNSQCWKGKHKHSETPCESCPVLSCPVLATQRTLELTDRRTQSIALFPIGFIFLF